MKPTAIPSSRLERSLIVGCGVLAAILVLIGFGKSYYFKLLCDAPALPALLHAHGAIMTAWFTLFCIQVVLVETRKVFWHRRLGIFGACLAAVVVLSGALVVWTAAVRETKMHSPDAHFFLILLGFDWFFLLPVFAILGSAPVVVLGQHLAFFALVNRTWIGIASKMVESP